MMPCSALLRAVVLTPLLVRAACSDPPKAGPVQPGGSGPSRGAPVSRLPVPPDTPHRMAMDREVTASGTIAAREEVIIGVELSSIRVDSVAVEVGDRVRRGDVLLRLDTRTLDVALAGADASVAQAQAALQLAIDKARRARTLVAQQLISAQSAEELVSAEQNARAQLAVSRAQRDQARLQRDYAQVRAPDDGVVSARSVQPGQLANPGAELLRLIRRGELEWRAELAEGDLIRVAPGTEVRIGGNGAAVVVGRVRQVSPALDARSRTGLIYADLDDSTGRLRAGMFAEGRIVLGRDQVLAVPAEAVLRRDGHAYVVVVDAGSRARMRRVEIGSTKGSQVEVRSGLGKGESIVARGAGFLNDGDLVRVVAKNAAPAESGPGR